jgi:hypothetical protein
MKILLSDKAVTVASFVIPPAGIGISSEGQQLARIMGIVFNLLRQPCALLFLDI